MKTTQELLNELARMAETLTSADVEGVESYYAAGGVCKEAGELLGIEDKYGFQGHSPDGVRIREEVGDLMFYLLRYLDSRNIPLRECLVSVIAKLKHRYPGGEFTPLLSQLRDKDGETAAMIAAVHRDRREAENG